VRAGVGNVCRTQPRVTRHPPGMETYREGDGADARCGMVGVGARLHGLVGAAEIVEAFFASPLSGGERHARRIRLIAGFEAAGDALPISAG